MLDSPRLNQTSSHNRLLEEATDDEDVVWVFVVRGKKTALLLGSVQFVGSLISFSLIADIGNPIGSQFMFTMQIITFASCGILLIPPFLNSFMSRFESFREKSRYLVLTVALWAFMVAFLSFLSAAVSSKAFEECRGLPNSFGVCAKMQAAISIAFIVSFSTMGSFLVIFLGSVIPRDITVKTYVRGLGRAATLAAARGSSGRVIDHGFESIPLDVVVQTNRPFTASAEWPLNVRPTDSSPNPSVRQTVDESMVDVIDEDDNSIEDRKSIDAMDII